MNAKLLSIAISGMLFSGAVFGQTDINQSLAGLASIELVIDKIDLDTRLHGLGETDVRKTVENVLQTAGISLAQPGTGQAVLEIKVHTFWDQRAMLYAFSVRAQVKRWLKLPQSQELIEAATWQSGEPTGLIGINRTHLINRAVEKVATEFVVAYLKANQKD